MTNYIAVAALLQFSNLTI